MHGVRLYCVTLFLLPWWQADKYQTNIAPFALSRSLATFWGKHTLLQHCVTCGKCRVIKFCNCYCVLKNCVLQSCFASVRFHQVLKLLYIMSAVFQVLHCFYYCFVAIEKVLNLSLTCAVNATNCVQVLLVMCQCKLFICTAAKPVMSANDETLSAQGASQCSECCSLSGPLYSMMRCTALHWCPLYFVLHCPLYSVQGCHRLHDESSQAPRPSPSPLIHFLHPLFHLHPHPYPAPTHFNHPLFSPFISSTIFSTPRWQ